MEKIFKIVQKSIKETKLNKTLKRILKFVKKNIAWQII